MPECRFAPFWTILGGEADTRWQITVHGGNGIAIGSLGQYKEDSSVANVVVKDVQILTNNKDMHNMAYIKTWMGEEVMQKGYESGNQPRGGGW